MKMKKVGVTLKVTEKTKQPFHNLKVLKKLYIFIASIEQVQHFLECHGMSVEVNALSTTVDHIAAVAINAMVQTTLHDYFTSRLFFFSVISHVKIVILTHIVEIRRLKVKYIVNLWIKDTSIKGTKCCVPLCPLKRGSTVYIFFFSYVRQNFDLRMLSFTRIARGNFRTLPVFYL